jgi:hypothetical protein
MWQLFLNDNTRRMYLLCWSARSSLPDAIRGHAVYYRQWQFLFPTALTDMFFTSACMSSWKMLVLLMTTSQNRWCKAYEGFYYTVGKKKTDMEQMSTREHPISDVTGWSKIDHLSVPSVYFISICIYFINVPHVYIFSYM